MEILVGQGNGTIVFWDSLKGSPMYVLRADPEEITEMQYDDSTRRLITSSKGRSIKVARSLNVVLGNPTILERC